MFEGLLYRILLTYFGKFIEGFDRRHISLGVMSGNLLVENVRIKKEAIDELELPITLQYSSISKLQLIVPWSKLSTSRVEIYIKNVYILVKAKEKSEWNVQDYNSYLSKKENIEQRIKKYLEEKSKNKTLLKE